MENIKYVKKLWSGKTYDPCFFENSTEAGRDSISINKDKLKPLIKH
jgi:hypothetical protein